MEVNPNDISTLINILSINFPIEYPQRDTSDQLDTFFPGITFPNYSVSQINKICSESNSIKQFRDILNDLHFYFPLVPDILEIIANYREPMIEPVFDYCACIVICSYVSWRIFSEFSQTMQDIEYLLNALPIVSNSNYSILVSSIYCDCLNYYLTNQKEFDFVILQKSFENLLLHNSKDIFNQIGPIFFNILTKYMNISKNSPLNEDNSSFVDYLGKVTEFYPKIFDADSTIQIISLLQEKICQLDTSSLHLFSNLCQYMPIEAFDSIFMIICQYFHETLWRIPFPNFPIIEDELVYQFSDIGYSNVNEPELFQEDSQIPLIDKTFSIKSRHSTPIVLKNNSKIGYYLSDELLTKLKYLSNVIQSKSRNIDSFFEYIQQDLHESKYFYSVVYIVSNLQLRRQQIETYYSIITSSSYFQTNYSSFKGQNEMVNQFRFEIINSISHFPNIYEFLLKFSEYPLLYSEILHFLYPYISQMVKHNFLAKKFLGLLCRSFIFFQKLNLTETDKEKLEIIESTRICILSLISNALNNSETEDVWTSNPLFLNFLLNLLFELPLRRFVIDHIQSILINFYHSENELMIMNFNKIINRSIEINDIDLLIDLIMMINAVFEHRSDSIYLFTNIVTVFLKSLKKIDESSKSQHFYLHVLNSLSFIHLTDEQFELLNETVKQFGFSSQIKESLFKLISGVRCSSKISPLLQPKAVLLILENLKNDEDLSSFLAKDLYPLLEHSIFNCVQAFKGGIESYLFAKFLEDKNQDLTKINVVKDIFNVLNTIHHVCASSETAKNIIRILEPIDSIHISHFSTFYIQSLKSMFQNQSETPKSFLPFSSKLEIYQIKSSIFDKSFEIAFWLYIEPFATTDSYTQICFISDSKGKGINISYSLNTIIIRYIKKHEEIIAFDYECPSGGWHLISLKFQLEKNHQINKNSPSSSGGIRSKLLSRSFSSKSIAITSFNSSFSSTSPLLTSNNKKSSDNSFTSSSNLVHSSLNNTEHLSKTKSIQRLFSVSLNIDNSVVGKSSMLLRSFYDKLISMTVGTTDDLYPMGYYSCVSIFPLSTRSIFWNSLKLISAEDPLLLVTFDQDSKPICETNTCKIIQTKSFFGSLTNLSDIFMSEVKIYSLVLLFAEFDFSAIDNQKIQSFPEMTIELFVAFLQSGRTAQISFLFSGCCDAIGHLLSVTDFSNLKYNTYLRFASVVKSIVVPRLKHNYLSSILLNVSIWGRCSTGILKSITSYWLQELYPQTTHLFTSILNYPLLLLMIGKFYFDEKIVNNLFQLILQSEKSLNGDKFCTLISFCTGDRKLEEIKIYLEVLKKILTETTISDEILSKKIQNISYLITLFDKNDPEIIVKVIDIIIICHRNNYIKQINLTQNLEIAMRRTQKTNSSMLTLKPLLEKANAKDPELYPLCCIIALYIGKEGIEYFSEHIRPSKFFSESLINLFWLIMIICTSENALREDVFAFLFDDSIIKIENTTTLIEIICIIFDHLPDHQLIPFLSQGFTMISSHTERFRLDCVHKILKTAYHSLLFRSKHAISKWISKLVEQSPFSNKVANEEPKQEFCLSLINDDDESIDFDEQTILSRISDLRSSKIPIAFQFWPSLDEDGNWLDTSLALQCMNIFEMYFSADLLMYDLILTSFMFKFKPNTAKSHLKRLPSLSTSINKVPSKIILFLYNSADNYKIDLSFISYPKPTINKLNMFSIVDEISDLVKTDIFDADLEKMASKLISIYSSNGKLEHKFLSLVDSNVGTLYLDLNAILSYKMSVKRLDMLNVWRQMWNEMTLKRGYWEHSTIAAFSTNHWKRSSLLCYTPAFQAYYPSKMVLNNLAFDDHLEASFVRDLGSLEEAQTKAQTYRNQAKKFGIIDSTLNIKMPNSKDFGILVSPKYYLIALKKGCLFKEKAVRISPKGIDKGYFEIYNGQFIVNKKAIMFTDIRNIFLKTRLHRPTAFEIFAKDGKSYFIDIPGVDHSKLINYFQPFMPKYQIDHYTEKWMNYEISNFEYLMKLNALSSRTFNDLSAYPIMPWIISDYQSDSLDLKNPAIYRDLSRPIGALMAGRLEKLKVNSLTTNNGIDRYLYSSGYVTQMGILSYLVRIEPFTSMHIKDQGGRFEQNAKIFKSIEQTYKNVTKVNGDFKEIIPEFYSTPEFLINSEHFVIGDESDDQTNIDTENLFDDNIKKYPGSVELPKWAKSSALYYVYMNRKALESSYVSEKINNWIDLIWGYKQKGQAAIQAANTFNPLMYSDVWDRGKEGQIQIQENDLEDFLSKVGQIPIQLFTTPHPQRNSDEKARFFTRSEIIKGETKHTVKDFRLLTSCFTNATIKSQPSDMRSPSKSPDANRLNNSNRNSVKYTKAAYNSRQKRDQLITTMIPQQKETSAVGLAKTECGKLVCITFRGNPSQSFVTTFDITSIGKIVDNKGEQLYYDIISPSFLFFSIDNGHAFKLYFPFKKLTFTSNSIYYRIKYAAFSLHTIVTAGDTSFSVWFFDQLKDPHFTLTTYRSPIKCIDISCAFDLVICGMTDGALQFTSINKKRIMKTIDLGDVVPLKIQISPGWGFVIVYCESTISNEKSLMFFTANGMKFNVLKIPNDDRISAMDVYKSRDGFDYMVIATENGQMYHFEVFFATLDKPFYTASFVIKSISFVAKQNAIYCTGDSNTILVLPSPSF